MDNRNAISPIVRFLRQRTPLVYFVLTRIFRFLGVRRNFPGSAIYWERNYHEGGSSGSGSLGRLAIFKSRVLNEFVKQNSIGRVIDFGCGDGNQLELFDFPAYVGFDVAKSAIKKCIAKFANDPDKSFFLYDPFCFKDNLSLFKSDLAISLDVIYHLVEDEVFNKYMEVLFNASSKFVIIYSSDFEEKQNYHERRRKFTAWIEQREQQYWRLIQKIENPFHYSQDQPGSTSLSDFYIYQKAEKTN